MLWAGVFLLAVNTLVMAAEAIQERRAANPSKLVAAVNRLLAETDDGAVVRDAVRTGILRRSTLDPVAMFGGLPDTIGLRPRWVTDVMATSETDLILGQTVDGLVLCSGSVWSVNEVVATVSLRDVQYVEYETRRMPWGRQSLIGLRFTDGTTVALAVKPPSRRAMGRFLTSTFAT